jgi:hypothetical protein
MNDTPTPVAMQPHGTNPQATFLIMVPATVLLDPTQGVQWQLRGNAPTYEMALTLAKQMKLTQFAISLQTIITFHDATILTPKPSLVTN